MAIPKKGSELSRAERKSKKRKAEDAIPDLPGDNENVEESEAGTAFRAEKHSKKRSRSEEENNAVGDGLESGTKAAKREKKKKRKTEDGGAIAVEDDPSAEQAKKSKKDKKDKKAKYDAKPPETDAQGSTIAKHSTETTEEAEPKKSKKERKAERKAKEAAEAAMVRSKEPVAMNSASTPARDATMTTVQTGEEAKTKRKNNRNREKKRMVKAEGEETKPARFIVFIGNLPFSATTESITKHFAKIKPKSVRHLTQKDNPTKSRGSAFVEFDGYDHMKTCLKLFHHSLFDDGISPARKINVELTVGGGGNTKDRRAKIEEKNQRLNEQRVRRIQEEEKTKYAKAAAGTPDESGIHPSRRAMVSGA